MPLMNARWIPPAISVLATVLAAPGWAGDRGSQILLAVAQTASLIWLAQLAWSGSRGWACAGVIVVAAWVPTFLVASWIYAVNPSLLDIGPPTQALAIVELSLLALIAGFVLRRCQPGPPGPEYIELHPAAPRPGRLVGWSIAGLIGLATVLIASGGPIHYVQNLNRSGSLTEGRAYFIVLALAIPFAAAAVICMRWSRDLSTGWLAAAGLVVGLGLVAVLGARLLIALTPVQLALFYALTRRRARVRTLLPAVILAGIALILGAGAVKRFTAYHELHPRVSLGRYIWSVAPAEVPTAYADNYADGVRLMALSRATVPRRADYEYGKELLRLLLQPLPSGVRPAITPAPGLKAALYPPGGYVYAQPLQAVSYIQFGIPGVVVVFALLGALIAEVDVRLGRLLRVRPSSLMLLTAGIADLPVVLRGSSTPSVAFSMASLVLIFLVARTSERLMGPHPHTEPADARERARGPRPATTGISPP